MRAAFSDALVAAAKRDPRVLLLTGDHGYALFDEFRRACPAQYINAGIAEQNMVGMAAGLARAGFKPIVYGLAAFVPIRVLEQIKIDICHDDLPVTLIGDGAGFVYSHLGTSHQATEDIACMRALPGITILSPADRFEMSACMALADGLNKPVYLRMGKSDIGDVHAGALDLKVGQLIDVVQGGGTQGSGIHFIATGSMLKAACELAALYPGAGVTSAPSIKPIDVAHVAAICRTSRVVVTLEEHTVAGGLGSLVAEIASEHAPVRICRIGVQDRFSEKCGNYAYLLTEHGLDHAAMRAQLDRFLQPHA
jgi:transketolase